ncbi:MAG: GAF domain-containing sensor histidine kinase [Chloroflexi bacterium]|nr:GAF domain-containing sensor histidine kinase [Chloroflexota bacterium]
MNDMEKRVEGYRRLIDISRDLASTLDLDVLLDRIIHAAADITGAEAASILLYDDAARQLNFQVATNLDLQTMRGLVVPLEGSFAGWIVTNRRPVRVANAHEDPRFYQTVEQKTRFTTEALLGVPLITKDKIVGVLEAINKQEGDFTDADEDLLLVLGAQAAVAIENTRLFQQSDLIAEFVHELRTPLASIGTSTYLLLRPEISQEQREQMIHNIHGETLRLNTLASSFLDLARLESGRVQFRLTQLDLLTLLKECAQVMQSMADENKITIAIEVPEGFPPVEADRDKLKQVVLNLVSNAIKYNCPNGTVTISAAPGSECWTLSVRDTGLGIPEKSLPHLFEKFFRVGAYEGKAPGTGLGLSICKQIVSGHGGSISVKSKLGEGTTFTIHIPSKK